MTNKSHTSTAAITVTKEGKKIAKNMNSFSYFAISIQCELYNFYYCFCLGQNSIIYVPGVINYLTPTEILAAEDIIMKSKVLLCSYECPLNTLMIALKTAKKHNGLLYSDPDILLHFDYLITSNVYKIK